MDKTRPTLAMRTDSSVWLLVGIAMVVNKTKEKLPERSVTSCLLGGVYIFTFDTDGQ